MKLELKHLAAYLPYGLKALDKYPDGKPLIRDINVNNIMAFVDGDIRSKPILRPLSDYTEDYANFWNYSFRDFKWAIINKEVSVLCWHDLLSKHYDVFGLIEKGLAVDINTI